MDHFAMQWWMNEEEKRKQQMKNNDIERLNHVMQREVQRVLHNYEINKETYKKLTHDRRLVSCTLWCLAYRNNFESLDVANLQFELLTQLAKNECSDDHQLKSLLPRFQNQLYFLR